MRKVTFATSLLLILATLFTTSLLAAEIIIVKCTCLTKQNPSECKIKTQEFQHLKWDESPFTNPDINWDREMLSDYCRRNKHDGCFCDGADKYSGKIL